MTERQQTLNDKNYKEDVKEINLEKTLYRQKILIDIFGSSFKSSKEQLDYALNQALNLTESQYGYIYLYNDKSCEFTLNTWTNGVMKDCEIIEPLTIYQLEKTGIWGEVVRQRKPIVVNNFEHPNPLKKGYPKGHVSIKSFMSVPVLIDGKIVAVIGLANKQDDYDDNDIFEIGMLMNGVWNAVERREKQEKLYIERKKYLQTIVSIGDAVLVVDKNKKIEMLNPIAEKLTGFTKEEAFGRDYKEIFLISNEKEGKPIKDPIESVFETNTIHELENNTVLTSKSGEKYYIDDSTAPIKDDSGVIAGAIMVFRDITEKKQKTNKIEYFSFHDPLTGLYNRRFIEESLNNLDKEENMPISVIMGDVNGLKLTNDIFGHNFGDILLKTVAHVLNKVCNTEDIIARWGGDEFVILMPKTTQSEAEDLMLRIKDEFSKEEIKAIKTSIALGAEIKENSNQNMIEIFNKAEEKMYIAKSLERDSYKSDAIELIIKKLHENSPREKGHSARVGQLCYDMGKELRLSEIEIKKLRDAGYLHDIGKIVLDRRLLENKFAMTDREWSEIKKHPIIGYRILNQFDNTIDLAETVLTHQERWDGSGYPKGLKGREIPLFSRIIGIAESYERKLYGAENFEPVTKEEALEAIQKKAGSQFDPYLTEIFIKMMSRYNDFQLSNIE